MEIKIKFFSWSGAFSVVGRGSMLTNYFFLFGLNHRLPKLAIIVSMCMGSLKLLGCSVTYRDFKQMYGNFEFSYYVTKNSKMLTVYLRFLV